MKKVLTVKMYLDEETQGGGDLLDNPQGTRAKTYLHKKLPRFEDYAAASLTIAEYAISREILGVLRGKRAHPFA